MDWKILVLGLILLVSVVKATDINNCGANLNNSGDTYYLTADIDNSGNIPCMTMQTDDVTLNCQGHSFGLSGVWVPGGWGIYVNANNIKIENCNIYGFDNNIFFDSTNNSIVQNTTLYNAGGLPLDYNFNRWDGIRLVNSFNNVFTDINSHSNNYNEIYLVNSENNTFYNTTANSGGICGIILSYSNNNSFFSTIAVGNDESGIRLDHSNDTVFSVVNASSNSDGVLISYSKNSTFSSVDANSNSNAGVRVDHSYNNNLTSTAANSNTHYGIYVGYYSDNNTFTDTIASDNHDKGLQISLSNNITVSDFDASSNWGASIYTSSSSNDTFYGIAINGSGVFIFSHNQNGIVIGGNYNNLTNVAINQEGGGSSINGDYNSLLNFTSANAAFLSYYSSEWAVLSVGGQYGNFSDITITNTSDGIASPSDGISVGSAYNSSISNVYIDTLSGGGIVSNGAMGYDLNISNVLITNCGWGIGGGSYSGAINYYNLDNITIINSTGNGIWCWDSCNFSNINIDNATQSMTWGNAGLIVAGGTVQNVSITNSGNGLGIFHSVPSFMNNITSHNNLVGIAFIAISGDLSDAIRNVSQYNNSFGLFLDSGDTISGVTIENGVYMENSASNVLDNVTLENGEYGLLLNTSSYNSITNSRIYNSTYGIYFTDFVPSGGGGPPPQMSENIVVNNTLYNNSIGLYLLDSDLNTIYNNLLNNTVNVYFENNLYCEGTVTFCEDILNETACNNQYGCLWDIDYGACYDNGLYYCNQFYNSITCNNQLGCVWNDTGIFHSNYWNTTTILGGGNFWVPYSMNCTNANADGFCDIPYDAINDVGCVGNCSNNTDYLPLAYISSPCGSRGLNITAWDELTNQQIYFDAYITNGTASMSVSDVWQFNETDCNASLPLGNVSVAVSNVSYYSPRYLYANVGLVIMKFYLLPLNDSNAVLATFIVQDAGTSPTVGIPNAFVEIYKDYGGWSVLMAARYTDGIGSMSMYVDSKTQYIANASAVGYYPKSVSALFYNSSVIYIYLNRLAYSFGFPNPYSDVNWTLQPESHDLYQDQNATTFIFTISSKNGTLTNYGMNITNASGSLLSTGSGSSANGSSISSIINQSANSDYLNVTVWFLSPTYAPTPFIQIVKYVIYPLSNGLGQQILGPGGLIATSGMSLFAMGLLALIISLAVCGAFSTIGFSIGKSGIIFTICMTAFAGLGFLSGSLWLELILIQVSFVIIRWL